MGVVLHSNDDLLAYLRGLARHLENHNMPGLAAEVDRVCVFAAGSASEFLGETAALLRSLRNSPSEVVTPEQRIDMDGVMKQIDEAFRQVGDSPWP